jgi:hypothetical protein
MSLFLTSLSLVIVQPCLLSGIYPGNHRYLGSGPSPFSVAGAGLLAFG